VTSSIGRLDQTVGESGGGDNDVVSGSNCRVDDSCLRGEGEGCQVSERGCGAARSEAWLSQSQ
jgi:hypothetical protein